MTTSAGCATSTEKDPRKAGVQAASEALEALNGRQPDVLIVFSTAGYDQRDLLSGVRDVAPDVALTGCSGEGVITREGSQEGSHAVAVLALASEDLETTTLGVEGMAENSEKAGRELADQILEQGPADPELIVIFPDGLTVNTTKLFDGLKAGFDAQDSPLPPIVGGTAGDLMAVDQTFQYHDDRVLSDGTAALAIGGNVEAEIGVSHGCLPIGLPREVTKAHENWVDEIDGKPAFEVLKEYLDDDPDELRAEDVVHMCFGEPLEGMEEDEYESYIIRTPLGLDPETGSLSFPAELPQGSRIQMTRRDPREISDRAGRLAREVADRQPGRDPLLVLHFDCAGRGRILFGEETNEKAIAPVQAAFSGDIPWMGFHTYGEIAPVGGEPRFHNYTVALAALYPR